MSGFSYESELNKIIVTDTLEVMIDLNDEDKDDIVDADELEENLQDDTDMKELLDVLNKQSSRTIAWLVDCLEGDLCYRKKHAVIKLDNLLYGGK